MLDTRDWQVTDKIYVECYDHDSDGGRDLIGSFETFMIDFIHPGYRWPLIGPATKKGSNSGYIVVKSAQLVAPPQTIFTNLPPAFQIKLSARRTRPQHLIWTHFRTIALPNIFLIHA